MLFMLISRFPCCVLLALSWNPMKIQVHISWVGQSTNATWVWGHNVPQAERSESPLSEDEEFRANGTQVRKSWVGWVRKIGGEGGGGVGYWWRYPDMTLSWHSSSPGSIWQPGGAHWEKEQLLNTVFLCDKLQPMIRRSLLEPACDFCNKFEGDSRGLLEVSHKQCLRQNFQGSGENKMQVRMFS